MKTFKSKFNRLEGKRFIFLEIGFIIAISAVMLAFNYRSYHSGSFLDLPAGNHEETEELPVITVQPKLPPPPPARPVTIFNITSDIEIEDVPIDIDVESTQSDPVELWQPPVTEEDPVPETVAFVKVESKPEFPGGGMAMISFLGKQLRYPEAARQANIQGTVYVSFVIQPDGSVSNVKVERGIGGGCDEEAVRVVKMMPRWKPGIQAGKKVKVPMVIPVRFRIMD